MDLYAYTTCTGLGAELARTAWNKLFFKSWCIITSPNDHDTRAVARLWGLDTHLTHQFDGAFRKGAAINEALSEAPRDAWVCVIDPDILLPPDFVERFERLGGGRDVETIYSIYRWYPSEVIKLEKNNLDFAPCCYGYFQLWHTSQYRDYPSKSQSGAWDDSEHAARFQKKKMVPLYAGHLGYPYQRDRWRGFKNKT